MQRFANGLGRMRQRMASTVFLCWFGLFGCYGLARGHILPQDEFPLKQRCNDQAVSFDFTRTIIETLGENFIRSDLVSCLNFVGSAITNIEDGAFAGLPNLTYLVLRDARLSAPRSLFSMGEVPSLKVLLLDRATRRGYRDWDYGASGSVPFTKNQFPELQLLSMRENEINGFRMEGISNEEVPYPNLVYLDLFGNRINTVDNRFPFSKTLKYLDMSNNSITTFDYPSMENLESLILDSNNIPDIGSLYTGGLTLVNYKNLRYLSLKYNNLQSIGADAFSDTTKLERIDLSNNRLENLESVSLDRLVSLKTLNLSNSLMGVFPRTTVDLVIEELDASCGKLRSLPCSALAHMPLLKNLYLSNNEIKWIDKAVFRRLSKLDILDLSKNELSYFEDGWCASLKSLRYLNLNDNRFLALESLALSSSLPLTQIHLANNPLAALNANSFKHLPENVTVYLDSTKVEKRRCNSRDATRYDYL